MGTLEVEGGAIEFEQRGDGPPVVLVHGSVIADPWEPMLNHGDLLDNNRVVTFHRRGYGRSLPAQPGRTLSDEAADVIALLDHLDIARAHVVGHSLAADIMLQTAIDNPRRLVTMTLLEPGLFSVPSAVGFDEAMRPLVQIYESGDHRQAMLLFLGGVGGADVMARLEGQLPEGTGELALADVPTLFENDLTAGSSWQLNEKVTGTLDHPTLLVMGSETGPIFRESNAALAALLRHVETLEVSGAGHFVHVEAPREIAEALADFVGRHATDSGSSK